MLTVGRSSNVRSRQPRGLKRNRAVRRFLADGTSRLSIVVITILLVIAILVEIDDQFFHRDIISHLLGDPYRTNLRNALLPPSLSHPFGTDHLGRDTLA